MPERGANLFGGSAGSDLASWMLLGGPAAALAFGLGVTGLGVATAGYSAVRQTVSELGPQGGRGRTALAGLNLIIALAMIVFACGLVVVARQWRLPVAPAFFVALAAVLTAGLAAFPSGFRSPIFPRLGLHNVVGLLQTFPFVGAPLSIALGWRGPGGLGPMSWAALVLIIIAMVLNLAPAFSPRLAKAFGPIYGLVQRSLFVAWYGWCAILGSLLFLRA
jgi:hypothetical protein